ncbi:MAG: hypothetical protein ACOC1G_05490 [Phycisphaeraceae bacterium]
MWSRLRSLGLGTRVIGLALIILVTVVSVNYVVFVDRFRGSAEHAMVDKAAAFTAVADETKNHVSKLNEQKAIDHETLLARLAEDQAAGRPYTESKIFQTIPVVAGWIAAEEQSAASEQVSRNIESISAISREANEGTSQAAQAAQSLSSKAESLLQLVGSFKIDSSAVQTSDDTPVSDEEAKLREAARAFREQNA